MKKQYEILIYSKISHGWGEILDQIKQCSPPYNQKGKPDGWILCEENVKRIGNCYVFKSVHFELAEKLYQALDESLEFKVINIHQNYKDFDLF